MQKIYEIDAGLVLVSNTLPDGRRQILDILGPGATLGVQLGRVSPWRVQTLTAVRLRRHKRRYFERSELCQRRAALQLETSVVALGELVTMLGRMSAPERIAAFLLKLVRVQSGPRRRLPLSGPVECGCPMPPTDIADYLRLSVASVCRHLAKLRRSGLIEIDRSGRLRIPDIAAIVAIVERGAARQKLPQ